MGITVGMPLLKLDRLDHFGNKNKHTGNAKAVLDEMLADKQMYDKKEKEYYRHCGDKDYNRDRTKDNKYYKFADDGEVYVLEDAVCAKDVYDQWIDAAEKYRVIDKNGKEKALRSDANIGFAGIIKPAGDQMQNLSPADQIKFLEDSIMCIKEIYEKRGMTLDYAVIHVDEGVTHAHYCGHDDKFQIGKKMGLKLRDALNKTDYPVLMRKRGWNVDALQGYDVDATKNMSPKEKETYDLQYIEYKKKKKEHGLSSKEYKAEQERKNAELQKKNKALQKENKELQSANENLKKEHELAQAIKLRNDKLRVDNDRLKSDNAYLDKQIAEKQKYLQNMSNQQILQAAECIKQQKNRDTAIYQQRVEQAEEQIPKRSHKTAGKIQPRQYDI